MSCTTCGSNVSCNCTTNRVSCGQAICCTSCNGNGCNSCNYGNNCYGNVVPASPQPYFNCAPACQETNTQKVIINQFAAALKVANSWNVPACGLTATLTIPGLVAITIGSYLWNAEFGYFEITAFDSGLQQVTVLNNCNEGNAAAGTNVPSCTEFLNAAPPANEESPNTPCVEIDFTAPDVGDCIDITLNNTNGILAGDVVQIGSGFYRIAEVKPNDIVTICNDGEGITPGTAVIAKDAAGNYNYCLQIISTSPCDRDVVSNGALIVCNSEGQTTTLEVPEDGWMIEGTAPQGENFVGAVPIGLVPFCTRLTAPLSIISGVALMTLTVGATGGYAVGDIIQIAGYPDVTGIPNYRLTITLIPDSTHVTGTMDPVPVASVVIPTNTLVCRIGCCELLRNEMEDLACDPLAFRLDVAPAVYTVPVTLDANNYFEAVVDAVISSVNISDAVCLDDVPYAVKAHLTLASNANFAMVPADLSELGTIYHELEAGFTVGNVGGRTLGKVVYTDVLGDSRASSVPPFPDIPAATFDMLPAPAPNYPLNYHQNDVTVMAILNAGSVATDLGLSYRTLVGDFEDAGLASFTSVDILVSGWIEIYKISG